MHFILFDRFIPNWFWFEKICLNLNWFQIAELSSRIESLEGDSIVNAHQNRLEMKIKELESKLELEQTTRSRMETQINRLKEGIEKINAECDLLRYSLVLFDQILKFF